MQSHYEINVSHKGIHLFATAPRSCVTTEEALRAFNEIIKRFPQEEGFQVTVTHWHVTGIASDPIFKEG